MTVRMMAGLAAAVLVATSALAQDKKPPEMPKPAPEMAKLDPFEGSWKCEGTMKESPFGPGGKMTSTANIQDDLNGFWQSGKIKGTMPNMPPFEGMFHTTFDTAAKQYVMMWVDNMGAWSTSTSKGWDGDKLVYEGEQKMGGQKVMTRDTFVKSAGTLKHSWEMQIDGKWTPLGDETCKK
jgi:hypothetical protein